jgi:hypothetical protein
MKKRLSFCAFFFCTVFFCHAAEYFAGEGVENLAVMHDFNGGAYVLYVQNGSLKALHEDSKDTIEKYEISGITDISGRITAVHKQESCGSPFFILTTDGPYLYFLTLENDNALYAHAVEIDAGRIPSQINSDASSVDKIRIYYTAGNHLYCLVVNRTDMSVQSDCSIRENMTAVFQYDVQKTKGRTEGFYIAKNNDKKYIVSLFSDDNGIYSFYDIPVLYSENPEVKQIASADGKSYYSISSAVGTIIYTIKNNIAFAAAGKDDAVCIENFYVTENKDGYICFLDYFDKDNVRHVYYGTALNTLFSAVTSDFPLYVPVSEDTSWIICAENRNWKFIQIKGHDAHAETKETAIAADSSLFALTYTTDVCLIFRNKDFTQLRCGYVTVNGYKKGNSIPVPEDAAADLKHLAEEEVVMNDFVYTGTNEVLLRFKEDIVLLNTVDAGIQMFSYAIYRSSIDLNGCLYAAYYNDSDITVTRYGVAK